MKKLVSLLVGLLGVFALASCGGNRENVISVCASELPHKDILENCCKDELKKLGYELEVKVLDWTIQNEAVASKEYDANYFQHVPYLLSGDHKDDLVAICKVHYEPLGIYYGKKKIALTEGKTFEICSDTSNAIRAFELLKAKGVIENAPISEDGTKLTFNSSSWTDGNVTVTLIDEQLLVASMNDYDFALLPCNTAYTGNITSERLVAKEDDVNQVAAKSNILAARKSDYLNDSKYKEKIDALANVLLSEKVAKYVQEKYLGNITCDSTSQIDLRK